MSRPWVEDLDVPAGTPDGKVPVTSDGMLVLGDPAGGTSGSVSGLALEFSTDPDLPTGQAAAAALSIPAAVTSDELTHPCVVFFAEKWNGYHYWMAVTPFGGSASEQHENPSLFVSNDGTTWSVPPGVTNPLDPWPGGSSYNSDTHLSTGPDGRLYLFWRRTDGSTADTIYYRASSDGAIWTAAAAVLAAGFGALLSPSILWDGSQWVMWVVSAPSGTGNNVMQRRTCATLTGAWSAPTTVTGLTLPAGREVWHPFVTQVGGEFLALINDAPDGIAGTGGDVYLARSADGLAWTIATAPAIPRSGAWHDKLYRSCFVTAVHDGRIAFDCWYAGLTVPGDVWKIGRTWLEFPEPIDATLVDAKGDLLVATGPDAVTRLPAGADDATLIADSSEATGLRWGAAASGELLMQDGVTSPPVPIEIEAGDDWLYEG